MEKNIIESEIEIEISKDEKWRYNLSKWSKKTGIWV